MGINLVAYNDIYININNINSCSHFSERKMTFKYQWQNHHIENESEHLIPHLISTIKAIGLFAKDIGPKLAERSFYPFLHLRIFCDTATGSG